MHEYTFAEVYVGMEEAFSVEITEDMLASFRNITGDDNPLHNDAAYAKEIGYANRVSYGMLTASFISTLAGVYIPGKYSLINKEELMFKKPVIIGDSLTIKGTVIEKNDKFRFIVLKVEIINQNEEMVALGKMDVGVTK